MSASLPPGPIADLFAHLRRLRLNAGQPSYRDLAGEAGVSYTTVHSAIRGPRVPKWGLLELIGESLNADQAELKRMWTAAWTAQNEGGEVAERSPEARIEAVRRGAADMLARLREIRTAPHIELTGTLSVTERTRVHKGKVNRVLFSPDCDTAATVGEDGMVRLWQPAGSPSPALEIEAHDGAVYGASFSRDGELLATAGRDRMVRIWRTKDGSPVGVPLEHDRSARDVAFGLPGGLLVSVSSDGATQIWDPLAGRVVDRPFPCRSRPLLCVAVSGDGATVAVGGADGIVESWDRTGTAAPVRLKAHTDQVKALAFDPVHRRLASSGMDRTTVLWDIGNGERIGEPVCVHNGTVYALAFSPDGAMLASGSYDGTIRAVDPAAPDEPCRILVRSRSSIRSIAFSPDGGVLAGATADGTLLLGSSTRSAVSGAELDEVQAAVERLLALTDR